jgi:hypothetical protein
LQPVDSVGFIDSLDLLDLALIEFLHQNLYNVSLLPPHFWLIKKGGTPPMIKHTSLLN